MNEQQEANEIIPVLAVRQPWASWIALNLKPLEVRSQNTKKRGPVAIYASRTKPKESEMDLFFRYFQDRLLPIPPVLQGHIIGLANLDTSFAVGSREAFRTLACNHHNPLDYYRDGLYFWEFKDMQLIEPHEFKFSGSIVWGKVDRKLLRITDIP